MKKIVILAGVFILFLITLIVIISPSQGNYIKIPQYTRSETKAICTENNLCRDYEVFCDREKVIGLSSITGAFIQFPETWQDPRTNEQKKLCSS